MHKISIFILFILFGSASFAIDNPDAPDYVAQFEARIAPLYSYVNEEAVSTSDYTLGYGKIYEGLDIELNTAYAQLLSKLDDPQKKLLRESQRNWLKYRDAEFNFIVSNWDQEKFGSSYAMSIGVYKSTIVKNRIIELLWYLKNYS